jgi:hypothetical protein
MSGQVVNVKVGSRTFVVPFHKGSSACEMTILDLMKQVADRVSVQTGARPIIRGLTRKETDALLYEQDIVPHVIGTDEIVVADVSGV